MNWQDNTGYVEHYPNEIRVVSEQVVPRTIDVTNVTHEAAPAIVVKNPRKGLLKRFFGMLFRRRPQVVRVVDNDPIR